MELKHGQCLSIHGLLCNVPSGKETFFGCVPHMWSDNNMEKARPIERV